MKGAIVEGRSTGYFLLGHLLVTADDIVEAVLNLPRQFLEWRPLFQSSMTDAPGYPEVAELRRQWVILAALITEKLAQMGVKILSLSDTVPTWLGIGGRFCQRPQPVQTDVFVASDTASAVPCGAVGLAGGQV